VSTPRRPWTRQELLLAINLYCKIPFGRIHLHNPDIIELAGLIDRSPGSVSFKLANFASIDPSLPRKGATNYSKLDAEVWKEFFADWDALAYESETALRRARNAPAEPDETQPLPEGIDRPALVRARVNQGFFRSAVLAAYGYACCITGLPVPDLLNASHIVPWAKDPKNRTNPRNGLCLNALHDRAFDRGPITLDENFRVRVSPSLPSKDTAANDLLHAYANTPIRLPKRFLPDPQLLAYHRSRVYNSGP